MLSNALDLPYLRLTALVMSLLRLTAGLKAYMWKNDLLTPCYACIDLWIKATCRTMPYFNVADVVFLIKYYDYSSSDE